MENNEIFKRPSRIQKIKNKKNFVTKKAHRWAAIAVTFLALGAAAAAAGAVAYFILEGDLKTKGMESTPASELQIGNLQGANLIKPESEKKQLQNDIAQMVQSSAVQQVSAADLTSPDATFQTVFLGQTSMLGKGITNVNEKVESLWDNFINKHFMKASVSGTTITNDPFTTSSADSSALDSLSDTTGPLGISSNLFVGTTTDPKTLHVTGETNLNDNTRIINEPPASGSTNQKTLIIGYSGTDNTVTTDDSTTTIHGKLDLTGATVVGLSTSGPTTSTSLVVTDTAEVRGETSLLDAVTIGDATGTPADLTVTGESSLLDDVTVGTTSATADLDVSGTVNVGSTSTLLGNVEIGDVATGGRAANLLVTGTTEVRGITTLLSDVTVGSTGTAADLTVTGESSLLDDVTVGTATATADLDVTGQASVEGVSSLLGDVTIGSTTGTAADLTVTGTTEVRGTTSLLADVTVGSTGTAADLTVTGTTEVRGTTSLLADVTVGSTGTAADLTVTGTTEVRGTTSLLADVTVGSTATAADLTVTGESSLSGDVIVGTATATADLDVSGTVNVGSTSTLLGNVEIGDVATGGTTANLLVTGTTEVRGITTLLSDVTVGNPGGTAANDFADLTITGHVTIGRAGLASGVGPLLSLTVNKRAQFQDTIEANRNLIVRGTSRLEGDTTIISTPPTSGTTERALTIGYNGNNPSLTTDDSTTTIKGNLDLSQAKVTGLPVADLGTSTEVSVTGDPTTWQNTPAKQGEIDLTSLGITQAGRLNLFVTLVLHPTGAGVNAEGLAYFRVYQHDFNQQSILETDLVVVEPFSDTTLEISVRRGGASGTSSWEQVRLGGGVAKLKATIRFEITTVNNHLILHFWGPRFADFNAGVNNPDIESVFGSSLTNGANEELNKIYDKMFGSASDAELKVFVGKVHS